MTYNHTHGSTAGICQSGISTLLAIRQFGNARNSFWLPHGASWPKITAGQEPVCSMR